MACGRLSSARARWRLGHGQAADDATREMPERFSRKELEDFARRHGIQSRDELIDLMGGSP